MKMPPVKIAQYDCIVCGGRHKRHDGDLIVCVQAIDDPGGDRELDGKKVRFEGRGVCLSCLLSNEMEEIMTAYHRRFAASSQTDPVVECEIAEAKARADSGFCLEDYLEEHGLPLPEEDEPPCASRAMEADEDGFREVAKAQDANCGNCAVRMAGGSWHCPTRDADVDTMHICNRYKPGLR